jgi:hypothetical protein
VTVRRRPSRKIKLGLDLHARQVTELLRHRRVDAQRRGQKRYPLDGFLVSVRPFSASVIWWGFPMRLGSETSSEPATSTGQRKPESLDRTKGHRIEQPPLLLGPCGNSLCAIRNRHGRESYEFSRDGRDR